jgi:arylmalonate decarboxylase
MSKTTRPRIGLIVPPAEGLVPEDARILYGEHIEFIARGLGISGISPAGFAPVVDRIVHLAMELRDQGVEAISLMGTSISFYRGAALTEQLRAEMKAATGLPCTTMSHAVVAALRALGARRVAVATSYIDELNQRLVAYLSDEGFMVTAIEGLSVVAVREVAEVPAETLIRLAESVVRRDPSAEAVFVSCGGLLTQHVIEPLEERLNLPAIASSPAGFWDVVKLVGADQSAQGFGRLFRAPYSGAGRGTTPDSATASAQQ